MLLIHVNRILEILAEPHLKGLEQSIKTFQTLCVLTFLIKYLFSLKVKTQIHFVRLTSQLIFCYNAQSYCVIYFIVLSLLQIHPYYLQIKYGNSYQDYQVLHLINIHP